MSEELINKMAEEYTKNYVASLKIVAEKAYKDGLRDMYQFMLDRLNVL